MKLSVKSDYAVRAVFALALAYRGGKAKRAETLASEQSIPANYLVQILIELKSQQIVQSVRGKSGGYLLARPPAEITFGDILRCVHGAIFDSPALQDPHCPAELRRTWQTLQGAVDGVADRITFQQLVDQHEKNGEMYYI